MKKGIVVILTLFLFSGLIAQNMGIKGGLNIANLAGDDIEDTDPKLGFVIGGFYCHSINEMFSIQPELLFTMKGAKNEDEYTEEDGGWEYYEKYEGSWNLNYLEIPVLAKLNIPMNGGFKPNLILGPALGINIGATYDQDYEYWIKDEYGDIIEEDSGSEDGDIEDTKGVDFSLVFGAGAEVGNITFDARYTMGLSTIDDSDYEADIKNSVISILLGYKF